ncbi:hypothetical protein FG386_003682 [Cryptosporidium ryanae]|uniref:uncharacterized protein n=1 Tax=Cryptosporidium ryanae TaxID=515981 RepID=UPI003519D99D|nr:hypothetical protein FG386_003682 [Cryptosporidium ryanae]
MCNLNDILIPPSPNWYSTNSLFVESSEMIYAYTTKNSIIIGSILNNKIIGSVYCGIKSKPICLVILQFVSDQDKISHESGYKTFLIISTHVDDKLRIWELRITKDYNNSIVNCSVELILDEIKIRSGTNVMIIDDENNEIVTGDTIGEISILNILYFSNNCKGSCDFIYDKVKYEKRRFKFFTYEITALCITKSGDNNVVVGYKSGTVLIFNKKNGELFKILEHSLFVGSPILSLVEHELNIWISTNRKDYIFMYDSIKIEINAKKLNMNSSKGNIIWNALAILNGKLYASCNNEILELDLKNLEDVDIIGNDQILRRISVSYNKKNDYYKTESRNSLISNTNLHIIFCIKTVKTNNGSLFLIGTTKSNIVFLVNIGLFKIEWANNTLGGWIESIISPYGYSHIIYIHTGDGKLIGIDMLSENKVHRSQMYDYSGHIGKGEKITKLSINYVYSQYICYLTNLGNVGILFINPNNITHYAELKFKTKFKKKIDFKNCYLDWFIFENTSLCENEPVKLFDSEFLDNFEFDESNGIDYNKKIYKQLLSEKYQHIIVLFDKVNVILRYIVLFGKKNDKNVFETIFEEININDFCSFCNNDQEPGDDIDNIRQHKIGNLDVFGLNFKYLCYKEDYIIKRKSTLYFSSVRKPLKKDYIYEFYMNDKSSTGNNVNLFVNKINFDIHVLSSAIINDGFCSENVGTKKSVKLKVKNVESIKVGNYILEKGDKVINGTVVIDNRYNNEINNEIYILVTRNGNLIIFLNNLINKPDKYNENNNILRIENIFMEKSKTIEYDHIDIDLIEDYERDNYGNNSIEFMIAVLNDMNKTSIFKFTCCLEKNIIRGEHIMIRSNLCHIESLVNKYNFKSNLILFRDTRHFNIEYGNNLKLIIGGQEQILQIFNIQRELNEKKRNLGINRNSLLFLTNKNIYQQNNKDCIESIYNMILLKMTIYLNEYNKVVNYDIIYSYLNGNDMLKYIFDFILFLNYGKSSIDLIDSHISYYSKLSDTESSSKYKSIQDIDEFKKNCNSDINDYLIEYIAMIKCDFSRTLEIIENYIKKNDLNMKVASITDSVNDDYNNEYLLFEWIKYLIDSKNKNKVPFNNRGLYSFDDEDLEEYCVIKSRILRVLKDLEKKLIDYKNKSYKNSTLINKNENILNEYCILSLLQGRIQKSIEMYCNYNLYQNAFLISNYFYGNDNDTTFEIIKKWLNHFISKELYFQSYKCYIAMNEYTRMHKDLFNRLTKLVSIKSSYENIYQVFSLFKITGYYNIIINLRQKSDKKTIIAFNNDSKKNLNEFSVNLLDCYSMFYINYYIESEIEDIIKNDNSGVSNNNNDKCNYYWGKHNIKKFVSINLNENKKNENMFSKLKLRCDEISKHISNNIILYELMFKTLSFMVCTKWEYKGLVFLINLLKQLEINTKSKDDLLLYIKKYSYLPFEDQLIDTKQVQLLKEFMLFILNINYDKYSLTWMFNLEKILILSYQVLFLNEDEISNTKVVYVLTNYLNKLFLLNNTLSALLVEDESINKCMISDKMEKKYQIIKYDLEVICAVLFLRKSEYIDQKLRHVISLLDELLIIKENCKKYKNKSKAEIIQSSIGYGLINDKNKIINLYNIINEMM